MKTIGIVLLCIIGIIVLLGVVWSIKNKIDMSKSWLPDDYYKQLNHEMPLEKK